LNCRRPNKSASFHQYDDVSEDEVIATRYKRSYRSLNGPRQIKVVGIQIRENLPSGHLDPFVYRGIHPRIRLAQPMERNDRSEASENIGGSISGLTIYDDVLDVGISLRRHGRKRQFDCSGRIQDRSDDADQR
jgi:hypothetical protein